jgi:3-phenylpropionate/trans-cinnamate dioxygenase ferredoxin reductase component
MNKLHVKYLLVGGGLASGAAAEAIRARDTEGDVLVVAQEVNRPYHRPPLSKAFLQRALPREELYLHPEGWFAARGIQLRTGRRVARLDTARHAVTLDSGEEVSFDRMLLATGASPKHLTIPGADLPNVFYLRTIEDADRLHHAVEKALREGRPHARGIGRGRVAVIGGGLLGAELAATLTTLGLSVDLVVGDPYPWRKFAGESVGRALVRHLESHDVTVHTGRPPRRLEGDGRVQRVVLDDDADNTVIAAGEPRVVACDFAVAAVGAVANRELLRGTPIAAERAILVDDHCRTSVPDVYAAGDCCAVLDPLYGKHRVIDHWENARVTGAIAGTNMSGGDAAYDAVSAFDSRVFDLRLKVWGSSRHIDHRVFRGTFSGEAPDVVEIGIAPDGRITQVIALNHAGEDELLRSLVAARVNVAGREEAMRDPGFELTALL